MPPKVYKKPSRDQAGQRSSQQNNDKMPLAEKWDINLKHVAENAHVMERIHTLTSILAGVVAGLFNANLYSGIFAYLGFHLLITLMIAGFKGNLQSYFMKKTDLLGGLGSGIMVFLCGWIITFNVVYTL